MRRACLALLLLLGCSDFPDLDAARSPGVDAAPYPTLLPLDQLLTGPAPRATPEALAGVAGRAQALRARAAALRARPVIEPPVKARMRAAVARSR